MKSSTFYRFFCFYSFCLSWCCQSCSLCLHSFSIMLSFILCSLTLSFSLSLYFFSLSTVVVILVKTPAKGLMQQVDSVQVDSYRESSHTCFSTLLGRLRSVGDSRQNVSGSRPAAACGRTGPPCPSTHVSLIYQNSKSAGSRLSHPGLQTTRLSSLVPCGYSAMGLVTFTVSMATKPLPSVC